MPQTRRIVKRDYLGRRTDRVKRIEGRRMQKRAEDGYSPSEIAEEFDRDLRTIRKHLDLTVRGYPKEEQEDNEVLPSHYSDPELGPHGRELFYFGKRVRDRIIVPEAAGILGISEDRSLLFWKGEGTISPRPLATDTEAFTVVKDWGNNFTDARRHPLFPLFEQHLEGNTSLQLLGDAVTAVGLCATAYRKLYTLIGRGLISKLPDLSADDLKGMAFSLIMDARHRLAGQGGLRFSYIPVRSSPPGIEILPLAWHLQLGCWRVGDVDTAGSLTRVANVHKQMIEGIPRWATYELVKTTSNKAQQGIKEFQRSLSPDARLRRLIVSSRCAECP